MSQDHLDATLGEAQKAIDEGGVPIGSILVLDGQIVARGHNRQKQLNSIIRHAEIDCIDNAHGLSNADYRRAVLYTTLSPCEMCAGAIVFFGIPKVIIAENQNYRGAEDYLSANGVEVVILNDSKAIDMLQEFDRKNPGVWNKGE
ncbi:MAG TPA: nucleoside deaminase [Anaerolineales bacterium]|jgi:cytosine deaminase